MIASLGSPFSSKFGGRKRILYFICTGDTCRSPMAAGYLRRLLKERGVESIDVRSAGVLTVTGLRASQEARQIMEAEGVDLSHHRSSQLSPDMIRRADLILGMTPYHVQRALRISEDARGKTYLLKEYARSDAKNIQISDPMGATLEVFKQRFKEIKKACEMMLKSPIVAQAEREARERARAARAEEARAKEAAASEARKKERRRPAKRARAAPARSKPSRPSRPKKARRPSRTKSRPRAARSRGSRSEKTKRKSLGRR